MVWAKLSGKDLNWRFFFVCFVFGIEELRFRDRPVLHHLHTSLEVGPLYTIFALNIEQIDQQKSNYFIES